MARVQIDTENFVEDFVAPPLEVCEQRDPKGRTVNHDRNQQPLRTTTSPRLRDD